uniref:Uncharacterized protein n=1 Tax=Cucumis sativus TaxID=3659 RepID=A0A0A0KTP5_CUCSA
MSELQQQQPQRQQQQQQPAYVYPDTAATSAGSQVPPPHHSNGSFGAVFIVLAVIVVISALACFLGRLCNRRVENHQRPKPEKSHSGARPTRGKEPKLHPDKEGDIEFGFDLRNPSGKGKFPSGGNGSTGNGNGGSKGKGNGNGPIGLNGPNGHGNSFKPFENGGETRSEIKHTDHHEGDFNFKAAGHHHV